LRGDDLARHGDALPHRDRGQRRVCRDATYRGGAIREPGTGERDRLLLGALRPDPYAVLAGQDPSEAVRTVRSEADTLGAARAVEEPDVAPVPVVRHRQLDRHVGRGDPGRDDDLATD